MNRPVMVPGEPALGAGLDFLFRPSGVAIVGASNDPNRIGGRPIAFMRRGGYAGRVFPVNPGHAEVQGLPAYASILDVRDNIDLAVIALPAALVSEAVDQCIARGIKALTIFTSGFAEIDAEGAAAQDRIRNQCRSAGVRLLGPNCLGLMNVRTGMFLTFSTVLDAVTLIPGSVSMASQSGAFGAYFCGLAAQRGIGFSQYVATGNESDVDTADCIAWLAGDPQTRVIAAYIEGCRSGDRLREALRLAKDAGKPVVIYKAGSSAIGAAAVNSHTGSLAGSDAIWDAILEAGGVHRVRSIQALQDTVYALSLGVRPKGRSVGIISGSGGVGISLADAVSDAGLDLRPMPPEAQADIKAMNPFASAMNPIDTTAQVLNDLTLFGRMLKIMLRDGGYDSVIVFLMQYAYDEKFFASWKKALLEVKQEFPDRLFVLCMAAPEKVARELEAEGFILFDDPGRAASAIAALAKGHPPVVACQPAGAAASPAAAHANAKDGAVTALDEIESRRLLEAAGVPFAPQVVASDMVGAVNGAETLGYPVVLKILSPDIAHKSDVGGVKINLGNAAEVRAAWTAIMAAAASAAPHAVIQGAVVAKMISGGVETIIGVHRDPTFGPMVMFGIGGVAVELYGDVAFRPAPLTPADAEKMIRSIKGFALLSGFRGKPAVNLAQLVDVVVSVGRLAAADDRIASAEINPFIALPDGGVAVDALVLKQRTAQGPTQ